MRMMGQSSAVLNDRCCKGQRLRPHGYSVQSHLTGYHDADCDRVGLTVSEITAIDMDCRFLQLSFSLVSRVW